jgi:uncharacterized membrane protein YhaH (DUF805 family)
MTAPDAIRGVLSQYATFSGRAGRPEFWWWGLFVLLISAVTALVDGVIFGRQIRITGSSPTATITRLGTAAPSSRSSAASR